MGEIVEEEEQEREEVAAPEEVEGGGSFPVAVEEDQQQEDSNGSEVVLEESPEIDASRTGEAGDPVEVDGGETREEETGADVELDEEEQQEEVDYGTDVVMESTEVSVKETPEKEENPEVEAECEKPKPKGFVEEEDCEAVEDDDAIETVCEFGPADSTLDTTFDRTGGIISSYSTEGFQYLLSGVRANVGAKPGSKNIFVFEVRIVEMLTPLDAPSSSHAHLPAKKHTLRVGFGTLAAGVLLGAHEQTISFDCDGGIWEGKRRQNHGGTRFGLNETVAVVLNLDENAEHGSNDRPAHQYGVKPLDVHTGMIRQLRRFLDNAQHERSVLHVEIERGLSATERKKLMSDYTTKKRVAVVCVGRPDEGYLDYTRGLVRADLERKKGTKARAEYKKKLTEFNKKKAEREAQKKRESLMEAAAKARKDAAEEARQKRQEAAARAAAAKKAAEARTSGAGTGDTVSPTAGGSGHSVGGAEMGADGGEEASGEKKEEEERQPQMPDVEVTVEEITAKMSGNGRFRQLSLPDMTHDAVSSSYLRFSLPSPTDELKPGIPVFNEIRFVWDEEEEARRYLSDWIRKHKIVEKVASIKGPSEWFTKQFESWAQAKVEWRKLDRMYRDKKGSEDKKGGEEQSTEEEDVWAAEDIDNVDGEQTPLYGRFEAVDWNLLGTRFELHLLCHSFKKDCSDEDITGIHRSLLEYYYHLYFKKSLVPGLCGAKSINELLDRLVTDTIMVGVDGVLAAVHEVDTPFSTFVRLTEAARRERQKLIEAGDKSVVLVVKEPVENHHHHHHDERSEAKSNSVRRRPSGGSRRGPSDGRWRSTVPRGGKGMGGGGGPRRSDSSVSLRPAPTAPPPQASAMPYRQAPPMQTVRRPRSPPPPRGPPQHVSHAPTRIDHRPAVPPQFSGPPGQPRVIAYNRFSASAKAMPSQQQQQIMRPQYGTNQYNSGYKRAYPSASSSTLPPPAAAASGQQQYYVSNESPNKRYRGYGEGGGGGKGGASWEQPRGGPSNTGNPGYHYRRFSGGPPPPAAAAQPRRRFMHTKEETVCVKDGQGGGVMCAVVAREMAMTVGCLPQWRSTLVSQLSTYTFHPISMETATDIGEVKLLPTPPVEGQTTEVAAQAAGSNKDVEMADAAGSDKPTEKAVEEPVFQEESDCAEDKSARVNVKCEFGTFDSTLDTYFDETNGVISSYSTEGFQYLLSGVRANVGAKPGSKNIFVFEVRIVEMLSVLDSPCNAQAQLPPHRSADEGDRNVERLGLCENEQRSARGMGILAASENGQEGRNARTDETPEEGRTLRLGDTRHVMRVGFTTLDGGLLLGDSELGVGFDAGLDNRMYAPGTPAAPSIIMGTNVAPNAPTAAFGLNDVVAVVLNLNENAEHAEAVMVIGLPDEGVFDYVDYIIKQNPYKYVELSERTMFDWFKASALRPIRRGPVASNDRPDFLFGIQPMDEGFVRQQLREFAKMPHGKKNLVMVEIRGGLLEEERDKIVEQFPNRERTAVVCVGKPNEEYLKYVKDIVKDEIFAEKELVRERKLNVMKQEFNIRQAERERLKKVREAAKAAEKARVEAAEEARRKREEAAKAEGKEEGEEASTEEDQKMPETTEETEEAAQGEKKKEAEEKKEEEVEEEEEPEPTLPPTEVTDEEINQRMSNGMYRKMPFSDISHRALSECYLNFTLPKDAEKTPKGLKAFDKVKFVWEKRAAAEKKLQGWVKGHKVVEKVASITGPTDWFKQQMEAWMNTKLEWRKAQRIYQEEQAKEKVKKTEEEKETKEETEGDLGKNRYEKSLLLDEKMPEKTEEESFAEVDVWAPENVCDVDGKKTPLFSKFQLVDWQLMNLRYELHLLCHAFERDATSQDADLKGIHKTLLQHYYQTYVMRGVLVPSLYGAHSLEQILDSLLVDSIMVDQNGVLKAVHDIDAPLSTFVRLTEAARREREAKVAGGDESAKLTVIQPVASHYGKGGARRSDYSRGGGSYQSYQQHSGPYHQRYNPASSRGSGGGQYQRGYQSSGKGYASGGPQQQPQYHTYKRPYDSAPYDQSKRQKGGGAPYYPGGGGKGYSRQY
ncbi:hypothetical protein FOL47_010832 [Perkinsus chesapeaki]|uniref:Uncharacterized protein n=1 Tax=Perkinsus chesapeaki TaxID=330153 RepID=A0A7J6MNS0_PERCH|nr:hypothetical protein FOL47_010832 [Perkinsus chesapeaki]